MTSDWLVVLQTDRSEEPPSSTYSFPVNSPRKDLNESVLEIKRSLDKSMKNIIHAFDESSKKKELARKHLEKLALHRRVDYTAPPSFKNAHKLSWEG